MFDQHCIDLETAKFSVLKVTFNKISNLLIDTQLRSEYLPYLNTDTLDGLSLFYILIAHSTIF